ncbi:glycosyltransferase family 87 protein [Nocardia africana]
MITVRTERRQLLRHQHSDDTRYFPRIPIVIGLALSVSAALLISALHGFLDLQVYRVDTLAWLHRGALYGPPLPVAGHTDLPFTYPPSAAVLMTPLAVMPLWLAEIAVTASSLACLWVTIWLVLSRVRPDLNPRSKAALATPVVIAMAALEPVHTTLWFGQINIILMAAVALDCLTEKPRWPRGVLIGIAAVTKLTPAAFVLYLLIRRDRKAAGTAAATAAGVVLAGFVLFPRTSTQYWLHAIVETGRIGAPYYAGNQSLKGLVYRLGLPDSAAVAVWLGVGLAVVAAGAVAMYLLLRAERTAGTGPIASGHAPAITKLSVAALLVNAAVLLLVSPVSWTHHWVWVAPALVTAALWSTSRSAVAVAGAIAVVTAPFLLGQVLVPGGGDRELDWNWWQHLLGNTYVLVAVALLGLALTRLLRRRAPALPATQSG